MNLTSVLVVSEVGVDGGARGKTILFGVYKRSGRVYTEIIPNCKKLVFRPLFGAK